MMRKARKCCIFSYRENERHRTSAWVRRETARRRRDIPRRPRRRDRFHAGTHTSQSGGRVASGRLERGFLRGHLEAWRLALRAQIATARARGTALSSVVPSFRRAPGSGSSFGQCAGSRRSSRRAWIRAGDEGRGRVHSFAFPGICCAGPRPLCARGGLGRGAVLVLGARCWCCWLACAHWATGRCCMPEVHVQVCSSTHM